MDEAAIERVLDILRPAPKQRTKCEQNVRMIVDDITSLQSAPTKRQKDSDAKKLVAAREVLEQKRFPWSFFVDEDLKRRFALLVHIAQLGAQANRGGQDRGLAYQRKIRAAEQAFILLLQWNDNPPTLGHGAYLDLTAALYEGATGEDANKAGDMQTACEAVIHRAETNGYNPDNAARLKPWEYRDYLA